MNLTKRTGCVCLTLLMAAGAYAKTTKTPAQVPFVQCEQWLDTVAVQTLFP